MYHFFEKHLGLLKVVTYNLPVKLLQNGLEEVQKSVERLFYWAAWADKFGGTVQETQIYGTVIKVIVTISF